MRQYAMTSLSGVIPRDSYSWRSSSGDLKVPSSRTLSPHGMFRAPGMWPPRCAPSCGYAGIAMSSPVNSCGLRTSTRTVAALRTRAITWSRSAWMGRHLGRHGTALRDPLRPAAVEDARMVHAVEREQPVRVGRKPVVLVAVEDDRGLVADAVRAKQRLQLFLGDPIARHRVLELRLPVEVDGAGNVSLTVQARVLGDLHDADLGVSQVIIQPRGFDEHLRVRVRSGHECSLPPT